jgi:hypothetical protein
MKSNEKRFNDLNEYVDRKLESLERRVKLVHNEVSSVKTDIIKTMKEYMERLYGWKKG